MHITRADQVRGPDSLLGFKVLIEAPAEQTRLRDGGGFDLPLEQKYMPAPWIWPYSKSAGAMGYLEQGLGLASQKMGVAGLKPIGAIYESIGSQIKTLILTNSRIVISFLSLFSKSIDVQ